MLGFRIWCWITPLLVCGVTTGPFLKNDSTALFEIQSPPDLLAVFPDGVPQRPSMFGRPVYGREFAVSGRLIRPNPDNYDACKPLTQAGAPMRPTTSGPLILLLERGNCTFVTKVRNAQNVGAAAVVVYDNENATMLPLMADDATGGDVVIPSMVVGLTDGLRIARAVDSTMPVLVTLQWNLPHPDNRVEWEMWTSSDDFASIGFKRQFARVTASLGQHAQFTPHYYIDPGTMYGCTSDRESEACENMCSNSGRYCSIHPSQDTAKGLSGEKVVQENLRQICLWETHTRDHNDSVLWFSYVNEFQDECAATSSRWTKECSESVMNKLQLNVSAVRECVNASGGAEVDGGVNTLLANEIHLKLVNGIFFFPTVTINTVVFSGSLSCRNPVQRHTCGLLSALCAGFAVGTAPSSCLVTECELGTLPDECGVCNRKNIKDACGVCFVNSSMSGFNQTCAGCDGVPNSKAAKDVCGVCKGPGKDKCGLCLPLDSPDRIPLNSPRECDSRQGAAFQMQPTPAPNNGVPVYAIVLWGSIMITIVGLAVFCLMRRREDRMRSNVDALLKSYLPMETQALMDEASRGQR